MNTKTALLIAATTATLGIGAVNHYTPHTVDDINRNRQQQQIEDLSDAHDTETERQRTAGTNGLDSENARRNTPSEHRPPEPRPKPRFRLP